MGKLFKWIGIIVTIVVIVAIVRNVECGVGSYKVKVKKEKADTVIVVVRDTIVVREPQAVKSERLRVRNYKVKVKKEKADSDYSNNSNYRADETTKRTKTDNMGNSPLISSNFPDSVNVQIPITQRVYEDSTYRAYVSGFDARLDSILLFPPTKYVTITAKETKSHWDIGMQAGYGITPKGFQPYIGIGISFNFRIEDLWK